MGHWGDAALFVANLAGGEAGPKRSDVRSQRILVRLVIMMVGDKHNEKHTAAR
jgi:hypothetical protein